MDNITVTKKNNKFYVEFIDRDVYSCTVKEINKLKDIILDKTSVAVESNDLVPIFVRIKTKSCVSGQTRPTVTIKNEIIFAALPELLVRYDYFLSSLNSSILSFISSFCSSICSFIFLVFSFILNLTA